MAELAIVQVSVLSSMMPTATMNLLSHSLTSTQSLVSNRQISSFKDEVVVLSEEATVT